MYLTMGGIFFHPCVSEFSLNDCTPGGVELEPPLVCVCGHRRDKWNLPVQNGGYCIFSKKKEKKKLFLGVVLLLPFTH